MAALNNETLIHLHIPKTAGTSLRAVFIEQFGARNVAYMMPDKRFVRSDALPFGTEELDIARRVVRRLGILETFSQAVAAHNRAAELRYFDISELTLQGVRLATGHIRRSDIPDDVSQLPMTTVVREPLERMWSHYTHWQEARGGMWWHHGSVAYADDVRFEDFATDPHLVNYQSKWLGNLCITAAGTSENLPSFLQQIGISQAARIPRLNPGMQNDIPSFDPGFVREFKALHETDYELHGRASI